MKDKMLIIGRGLAGATLSLELHHRNISHDIVDDSSLSQSSRVAAGVINPLVLKRLNLVKNASGYLTAAREFYPQWEATLQSRFFHPIALLHLLQSAGEANQWEAKSAAPSYQAFLGSISSSPNQHLQKGFGYAEVKGAAWLSTKKYLEAHYLYHVSRKKAQLYNLPFSTNSLKPALINSYQAVILCTGHLMRGLFPPLEPAFQPTRGELLIIETDALDGKYMLHGPVFILPLGGKHYKVGATYHWEDFSDQPTTAGRQQLEEKLQKIFTGPYRVVEHLAGVRPNTRDRQPLLGQVDAGLYCFNGLGSRGALLAPALARILTDHLTEGQKIPARLSVQRFFTQ